MHLISGLNEMSCMGILLTDTIIQWNASVVLLQFVEVIGTSARLPPSYNQWVNEVPSTQ